MTTLLENKNIAAILKKIVDSILVMITFLSISLFVT